MSSLEAAFQQASLDDAAWVTKRGYFPGYFVEMVYKLGGVGAAHRLLEQEEPSAGLMRLWEMGLLDHSLEAMVLKPEYASLFSAEELATARRKLADLEYRAPWDTGADDTP